MALSIELLRASSYISFHLPLVLLDASVNIKGSQYMYRLKVSRPCLNVELVGGTLGTASWLGVPHVSPPNTHLTDPPPRLLIGQDK